MIGLVLIGYFVGGLAIFSLRARRIPADADVASRVDSPLLGKYLRRYLVWMISPFEQALIRLGVTPNGITLLSLVAAIAAACALGAGRFGLGGWLYYLTGILDILDGRVARATGRVTRGGAYFDSVIDRYAELIVFGGLAFRHRDSWLFGVVLAAALGSIMVSYTRARGEALGIDVKIGTMQRPERVFYLGLALVLSPLAQLLPAALAGLAISTNWTAISRIRHTMKRLEPTCADYSRT